jgi:peptide/nickel transport system permease protein
VTGFLLRRLAASLVLLFLVLTATFFVIHLAPGDPTWLLEDPRIPAEHRARLRAFYGLDQPLAVQYGRWLGAAVRGDWGSSITAGRPAATVLAEKLPATALLVAAAILVEHVLALPRGVIAAARAGGRLDRAIRIVSLALYAVPIFWLALVAIELLGVRAGLFPIGQVRSEGFHGLSAIGRIGDVLHHLALPALVLGLASFGGAVRFLRHGLLDALGQDYVRAARARGLSPARVLWVHAFPNALGPLIQRLGLSLPFLLSGSLLVEVVFAWPGMGRAVYLAVLERDYPVILGATALSGLFVVAGSLLADLLHAWVDPRVRLA